MAEPADNRRAELIAAAQTKWIAALTDMGGRNTLLYYKDRRASTLDLGAADPQVLERFLETGSVRLTRLFRDVDLRADAIRRVQAIYRKAKELAEERGINAGYLAIGLARWDELFLEPAAPVLLRGLTISPTRARHDDFDLVLDDESEVNPVLLHKLATVFGAETGALGGEPVTGPDVVYERLRRIAKDADVPGFDIAHRKVIGTFTYAKLPMVRDLQNADELLADSDVVAAIAGDPEAQTGLHPDHGSPAEAIAHDTVPPEDDYTVLDADSSQSSAINAVLRGGSLVIHGPPGTGKSQTIANLIATLVARGRKVLFVAEKRAAIDAVLSRLKGVGLGDIVLDIHDGTRDRLRIARDLGATLDRSQQTSPPDVLNLHRRLVDRRRRLAQHADALHEVHQPWGVTAFQVQSALLGIPEAARTAVRLPDVERVGGDTVDRLRDELREYAHLGGFALRPEATPWYGATVHTPQQAKQAYDLAARLCTRSLPRARDQIARAAAETGLYAPRGYAEWGERLRLYVAIQETRRKLAPQVYDARPDLLAAATAPREDRTGPGPGPGPARPSWSERRALVKRARSMWLLGKPEREELHQALTEAAAQLAAWMRLRADAGPPRVPSNLADALRRHAECEEQLAALRAFVQVPGDAEPMLSALYADRDTPWKLPRLYELRAGFAELGLRPLVDELTARSAGPDLAVQALDHAWYASLLDVIRVRDPRYAAHRGDALDEIAADFRDHDVEHLTANRARVRRAVADRLHDAQDHHPLQARVIRKQAALRRRHMPLRRLLDQASDVLFALKPCWAMSPLVVSQVLPTSRLFDVVIFDEASQIIPADAIPSIMRAHQVVVAGDGHQLPPTNFFRQVGDGDASEDDAEGDGGPDDGVVSFGSGFESVLDTLRPLLPTWPLTWHYRSRDERLVAFSNARIYDGALMTFPGVFRDDCLRHVVVAQDTAPGQEASVTAEVNRVVELILEHARTRPEESLGVIALGIKHAERIDEALRAALAEDPKPPASEDELEDNEDELEDDEPDDEQRAEEERLAAERAAAERAALEEFFAEDKPEPFFVKNLERVQGDERDAIILSIGYGKHPDGRMRYHWGPLLRDGGERRLNVAATRAKHRLTLVSSFSVHDVDPERVTKPGARLLAEYLEYAGSGGAQLSGKAATDAEAELNLFQHDVRERLRGLGITVVPQFGVGGYRVDFAAAHPDEPGRMVLAIEADGPSYHASRSARDRDRLRKEHLERLGWVFHRIWSTNWFHDPDGEVAKLQAAYERAISATPAGDAVSSEDGSVPAR
ncbi:MAG TPA: AAA domain-containing protein [Streptosporangiaceae bacterium]|nr:AAA domain-containing protein [Streptosporangiaceae bacterium]